MHIWERKFSTQSISDCDGKEEVWNLFIWCIVLSEISDPLFVLVAWLIGLNIYSGNYFIELGIFVVGKSCRCCLINRSIWFIFEVRTATRLKFWRWMKLKFLSIFCNFLSKAKLWMSNHVLQPQMLDVISLNFG